MERVKLENRAPDPIVVVGSVAYDTIETPKTKGNRILGGSASYASLAASYYAPTHLVGVVGNDFSEEDLQRLRRHQIDLEGLQVDPSGPTFTWSGRYMANFDSRETLDLQLNVFESFRPEIPASARESRFLMLGNIHPGLQLHVLSQMTEQPFVLADTIDLWIEVEKEKLFEVISKINLLAINDQEALQLTNTPTIYDAGEALLEAGPEMVAIKKGSHGCLLMSKDQWFSLPSFPVRNLQDPTGAGDSFAGALLGYLAATGQTDFNAVRLALLHATAAASLTVEAFSCDRLEHAGVPTLLERVEILKKITQIP